MKPTIIYLAHETEKVLEQLSVQGRKTPSEIIQEAIQLDIATCTLI